MESVADGTTTSHTVKGSVASANVVSFAEDRTLPTLESTSVQVGAKPDDKKHIRPLATHPLPPLPQGTAHTVSASDVSPCPVSIQSDINLASENTSVTQISAAHSTMLPVPPLNPCTQISAVHSAMLPAHPLNPCTQISAAHSTTLPALPPARVDPKYASFPQHKYHGQSCSEPSTNDSTQNELIPRCQRMASLIRWTSIYCSRANVQLPAHSRQQSGPSIPSASMICMVYRFQQYHMWWSLKDHTPIKPSSKRSGPNNLPSCRPEYPIPHAATEPIWLWGIQRYPLLSNHLLTLMGGLGPAA